jgi:hypothetical protein
MSVSFAKFPIAILMAKDLSPQARIVWAYLRYRQGRNKTSWPSLETIGRDLGFSKSSAGRAVAELELAGLMTIIRPAEKGRGHYSRYEIKGPPVDLLKKETVQNGPFKGSTRGKEVDTVGTRGTQHTQFTPPTLGEVREYADSIGYTQLDAEYFCQRYAATDWRFADGKPIKNWQLTVLGWKKRDNGQSSHKDGNAGQAETYFGTRPATEDDLARLEAEGVSV